MTQTMSEKWINLAKQGTKESIDEIVINLNKNMTLAESRSIDLALSYVDTPEGIETMKYYLFHGTQIQRNYCALYFGRIHEYPLLREAYDKGLIDEIQAFSR